MQGSIYILEPESWDLAAIDRNRLLHEQNTQLQQEIQRRLQIIGDSKVMRRLLEKIHQVATVPRPLLIVGERGTGKELVARAVHHLAGEAARVLVTVNCAAFSDALLES